MLFPRNMVPRHSTWLAALGLVFAAGCGHGGGTGSATEWKPDSALSARLGPEVVFDGYAFRPPLGWTEQQRPVDPAARAWVVRVWLSPPHPDGVRTWLWVQVGTGATEEPGRQAAAILVNTCLKRMAETHTGMTLSVLQNGAIGGLESTRCYWKGTGLRTGEAFHGFVYASVTSPTAVELEARDSEPYSSSTLSLCETSILTVRKI